MNIMEIRSLAALKMEKNFTAVIDKNYPRMPHLEYPVFSNDELNLAYFVTREQSELDEALKTLSHWGFWNNEGTSQAYWRGFNEEEFRIMSPSVRTGFLVTTVDALLEIADVSNTLDYLFEALLRVYTEGKTT